jgi:hypothetical protein
MLHDDVLRHLDEVDLCLTSCATRYPLQMFTYLTVPYYRMDPDPPFNRFVLELCLSDNCHLVFLQIIPSISKHHRLQEKV